MTRAENRTGTFKSFAGWKSDITALKDYADLLPEHMKKYIDFINNYLKVNVSYISNGPARDQLIENLIICQPNQKIISKKIWLIKNFAEILQYNLIGIWHQNLIRRKRIQKNPHLSHRKKLPAKHLQNQKKKKMMMKRMMRMMDTPKTTAKKGRQSNRHPKIKKKSDEDDDDDDAEGEDEVDDWDKVEEEEEWDPDFDEFDIPKSKTKKAEHRVGKKSAKADEDDLGLDDEFKNLDLFNDSGFDEEEDDF